MLEREVLIKFIDCIRFKDDLPDDEIYYNEIEMNKKVDHPCFLKMLDYKINRDLIVIV